MPPGQGTSQFPQIQGEFPVGAGLTPSGGGCRTLSPGTIWELVGQYWANDPLADRGIAAAVMLAESGGRTCARHVNRDGSVDLGAWQINMRAHPDVSESCARDSACSTAAAHRIYLAAGKSFRPWTTFTSGAYKQHLGEVSIEDASAPELGLAQVKPLDHALGVLDKFAELIGGLFTGEFWRRAGLILLGILALIGGVLFIGREYLPTPGPVGKIIRGTT